MTNNSAYDSWDNLYKVTYNVIGLPVCAAMSCFRLSTVIANVIIIFEVRYHHQILLKLIPMNAYGQTIIPMYFCSKSRKLRSHFGFQRYFYVLLFTRKLDLLEVKHNIGSTGSHGHGSRELPHIPPIYGIAVVDHVRLMRFSIVTFVD